MARALPRPLLIAAACLAFTVVVLGAYVRLSDAGLGCPDWPGCYGHVTPWHAQDRIEAVLAVHPDGPVSHAKAWKEMAHRYLAGGLGLFILSIAVLAWRRLPPSRRVLPSVLLILVIFQALLGMWTVTEQLRPVVVASHLLGGMSTLALLVWLALRDRTGMGLRPTMAHGPMPTGLARGVLALVVLQIALGGWVSANYAALACPDLPTCLGVWWPATDFASAFGLRHVLGGLSVQALTTIHLAHRIGAVLVLSGGLLLAYRLLRAPGGLHAGAWLLAVVLAQCLLGIGNVVLSLPLPVAVAHNAGAAALLLVLVWVNVGLARRRA